MSYHKISPQEVPPVKKHTPPGGGVSTEIDKSDTPSPLKGAGFQAISAARPASCEALARVVAAAGG